MMVTSIRARPIYDQPYEGCLRRPEVAESIMLLSYPGELHVTLHPAVSADVAQEIAACLRALPGEPLTVEVFRRDALE